MTPPARWLTGFGRQRSTTSSGSSTSSARTDRSGGWSLSTTWERSNNYITEVWQDSGEAGLRQVIRDETGTDSHSCAD